MAISDDQLTDMQRNAQKSSTVQAHDKISEMRKMFLPTPSLAIVMFHPLSHQGLSHNMHAFEAICPWISILYSGTSNKRV